MRTHPPDASPQRRRTRPVALAALVALFLGFLVVTANPAQAATLLSQGKPVTASSSEGAGTPASAAVDGDPGTRWGSVFADPQWLQVDLGSTATISEVVLRWEAAYATAFRIEVSDNANDWRTVYSTTTGAGGNQTLAVNGTGRYVRMYGTARGTAWGYSLFEFEVYS